MGNPRKTGEGDEEEWDFFILGAKSRNGSYFFPRSEVKAPIRGSACLARRDLRESLLARSHLVGKSAWLSAPFDEANVVDRPEAEGTVR